MLGTEPRTSVSLSCCSWKSHGFEEIAGFGDASSKRARPVAVYI